MGRWEDEYCRRACLTVLMTKNRPFSRKEEIGDLCLVCPGGLEPPTFRTTI